MVTNSDHNLHFFQGGAETTHEECAADLWHGERFCCHLGRWKCGDLGQSRLWRERPRGERSAERHVDGQNFKQVVLECAMQGWGAWCGDIFCVFSVAQKQYLNLASWKTTHLQSLNFEWFLPQYDSIVFRRILGIFQPTSCIAVRLVGMWSSNYSSFCWII